MITRVVACLFSLLLVSGAVIGQVAPVLVDRNGEYIGIILGSDADPESASRRFTLTTPQGYLATIGYSPAGTLVDRPGYMASAEFYESIDCTGDPVVKPNAWLSIQQLGSPVGNVQLRLSRVMLSGFPRIGAGEMVERLDGLFFVPLDAGSESAFDIGSYRNGASGCNILDRCNMFHRAAYPHLLQFPMRADLVDCPGEEGADQKAVFRIAGMRLSQLVPNDPAITGFANTAFERPHHIRLMDLSVVYGNGFELFRR